MKRHCPRCGKPTAIVVTAKTHDTELGAIDEQQYRCEDCFHHFKIHSRAWDLFWAVFAACMAVAGIAVIAGVMDTAEGQRIPIVLLLLAQAIAAAIYSAHLFRVRARATLVP